MFFIAYAIKGQVRVFAGRAKIVSHSSCRTSAILKYFCLLPVNISLFLFQYIENLDRMKRLQVLNLSNNIIERVEKLDKLLKLKELNLSMNCITKIEGLENLTNLQLLNLTGNLIEHIPIWIGKRLKSLRAFHIGRNKLESVRTNCNYFLIIQFKHVFWVHKRTVSLRGQKNRLI